MIGDWKNSDLCLEDGIKPATATLINLQSIYNVCLEGVKVIDEYWTWIFYGYHSDDLKPKSHKPIVAVCEECWQYRSVQMKDSHGLCRKCSLIATPKSAVWKKSASEARRGIPKSHAHRAAISKAKTGVSREPFSDEWKAAMSRSREEHRESYEPCYENMRGGQDVVEHHMIYDHSDLTKNILPMTRSIHMMLHQLFRKHGILIPHINTQETTA